jgi:hypothetical protein
MVNSLVLITAFWDVLLCIHIITPCLQCNNFFYIVLIIPLGLSTDLGCLPSSNKSIHLITESLFHPWKSLHTATNHNRHNNLKYSGTSVYVCFGISPTWYTSCLDEKNFAWYTTFVWNMARVLGLVWVKMSHDRQKQSSLDRLSVKVKPGEPQPGPTREKRKRKNTRMSDSWSSIGSGLSFQTITSPQHHVSKQGKVRLNFHLFHLIAFLFMYFSIK